MNSWNTELRTPVIIAAYNEEEYIGRTLESLDADTVAPLVIVNGSNDATAEIARQYTDQVIDREEQGKMPALQAGIKHLGTKALDGVLFLDADSTPKYPRHWAAALTHSYTQHHAPVVTAGRLRFVDGDDFSNTLRNVQRMRQVKAATINEDVSAVFGANMGVYFHDQDLIDQFLAAEHIWPGEDKFLADQVVANGGSLEYVTHRYGDVLTSARYYPSLKTRLTKGKDFAAAQSQQFYEDRAAESVAATYADGQLLTSDRSGPKA